MSPVIRIPDHVYQRLQQHATPFVDTPAIVVERLLDFFDANHGGASAPPAPAPKPGGTEYDPDAPPDLRHTRIIDAAVGPNQVRKWNEFLQLAHRLAAEAGHDFDAIRKMTHTNIYEGECTDRGFVYLADIGISIQNVDSNHAWKQTLHLAKQLGLPVEVNFEWRNNEKAAHPGEKGTLHWKP